MKELLIKYINGNCTDQEKVEVTNWLDEDSKNMREYLDLKKLNEILIWQTNSTILDHQKQKSKVVLISRKRYFKLAKIAAIFIFAFISFKFLYQDFTSQAQLTKMQTLHIPTGQRAEITLQDGTRVWLNANSTLTFPSDFLGNNREVKLDGEGFFDVAHNKAKPFIVNTQQYNVKVWGTKFNLIAYSEKDNFETSLLEGSVEVIRTGSSKGVILKPNDQIYLKDDQLVMSPIRNIDHFLWREGIISFEDATFEDLVKKLELYFDLTIDVKNTQVLGDHFSGKFKMKDGVEHILKVLQLKSNFIYKINESRNNITIE